MSSYEIVVNESEIVSAIKQTLRPHIDVGDAKVVFLASITQEGEMINLRARVTSGAPLRESTEEAMIEKQDVSTEKRRM